MLFVSGPFFVQFVCNCCAFFMPFPFLGWLLLRRARIRLTRLRCRRPQLKRKMGKSQSAKPRAQLRSLIPPPPRLRLRSTGSSYRCGVKSTLDWGNGNGSHLFQLRLGYIYTVYGIIYYIYYYIIYICISILGFFSSAETPHGEKQQ